MKNNIIILSLLIALAAVMNSCGTFKKANATTPTGQTTTITTPTTDTEACNAILATLGDWQTMQAGGNIKLNAGSSFSSSIQVRMVRDQAIYISLRPVLGIEVGKLIITADSLYAVDKVHKRYIAEKVSILTSGIPVTVSEVQDMFLGRPFIIGKGTINEELKSGINVSREGNTVILSPDEQFKGYGYAFTFDKQGRISSLDIIKAGNTSSDYKVNYGDVRGTTAGNIAHDINANAIVEKKKITFSLNYKDIDWNDKVKIDMGVPSNYKRMNAKDLFSMFAN